MTAHFPAIPPEPSLEVEEAQRIVLAAVGTAGTERVPLLEAHGRILREDIVAPYDVPRFDNSAMDGYAVIAGDLAQASAESPVVLRVAGDVPAGSRPAASLGSGTAMRIMTGGFLPSGADAVARVEITDAGIEAVRIFEAVHMGANVRRRGEDMRAGHTVLRAGVAIGAGEAGVLATARQREVAVSIRPRVAILSTGSEIGDLDDNGASDGRPIVNSNAYSLTALARDAGALPRALGTVSDDVRAIAGAIESAAAAHDLIVSTGGVSVGAYDFVREALVQLGATILFWRVAMRPGKPVLVARVRDRLYFGLPGNPVSCMVSFVLFVAPAIRKAMALSSGVLPPVVRMPLAKSVRRGDKRSYLRVRVIATDGAIRAEPMAAQGSGVSTSMAGANGLAVVCAGSGELTAGSIVDVVLLGSIVAGTT